MFVDAIHTRKTDKIKIAERINGKRILREVKPVYEFYVEDDNGTTRTVTGEMSTLVVCANSFDMKDRVSEYKKLGRKTFESDFNTLFKTLSKYYKNESAPELNVAFFDIETDFSKTRGYAPVDDPFNKVTAVSMYLTWKKELIMLVIKPDSMTQQLAENITSQFTNHEGTVILCDSEVQMLRMFLDLIEDADVLSGWNSEFYDIPYLVNRVRMIMSDAETARFCLWNEKPKARTAENFGKEVQTYDLIGRIHLDYLSLFKKHTYQEMQSYKLDYIGEIVTGERKVEYEGNLDQLYNDDFYKFIEYGLQDSKLLKLIDDKKDFISLHNQLAHQECVPIATTMGSVALIDTAIVNEIHTWGEVVFDKMRKPDAEHGAAGAWVADPVKGLHDYIGCIDLNSLYPSVLRSLKMSTEGILGQVRQTYTDIYLDDRIAKQRAKSKSKNFEPSWTDAWHGLFASVEHTKIIEGTDDEMIIDLDDGQVLHMTAREIKDFIFSDESSIVMSANGTLFDNTIRGAIPSILTKWYLERQLMQRAVMNLTNLAGLSDLEEERGLTDEQFAVVKNEHTVREWLESNSPDVKYENRDGKWFAVDPKLAKEQASYWKMMQQIRKILLNSLYGALLNKGSRFYDQRLGQSVTLTGRSITKHMACQINKEMTGNYDYIGGPIVYGDTDSVYFSIQKYLNEIGDTTVLSKDDVVDLYLHVGDQVDNTFPGFMNNNFNTGIENGKIIAAGLEIAGSRGLFLKKKRYGILKYWEDGFRLDTKGPGKLKAMGIEIKRSDTPKYIQNFLEDVFVKLLNNGTEEDLRQTIVDFKKEFKDMDAWRKGSPKTVKNLTNKTAIWKQTGKCSVGHVLAGINWNYLREFNNDVVSPDIVDGSKIVVCKLQDNPTGITTIAFPSEYIDRVPQWFKDLPFDIDGMTETVLIKKLDNLFGIIDMDIGIHEDVNSSINNTDLFSW